MKRRFLIGCLSIGVALCAMAPAFAAGDSTASQYSLGDQTLSINAGTFIPLFLFGGNPQVGNMNLSVGGVGTIDWAAYLSPHWRIGASLGGTFTFDPNYTLLLMVPIVAKISYLIDFYPWEVPLTFGAGMNIIKYSADSTIDLLLKPGTGILWTYNSSWSFGLNLNWWWDMQFS
ncbi:MAG TPA: hypothetical protein VL354_07735, partial [Spirochaetia bacterium]|nr:hypothetical protein [Spirochaetia bacterium]